MPLIDNFDNAGPGIVTAYDIDSRLYRVGDDVAFIDYREEITTESREWVGLTYAAAFNAVNQNAQPGDSKATHSWSMSESQRIIGSYTLNRIYEKKDISIAAESDIPLMGVPSFSVGSGIVTEFPFDMTITSPNTSDVLRYRIDAMDQNGTYVFGQYIETTQNQVTISIDSDISKKGLNQDHKQILIVAHTRRYTPQGVFDGQEVERVYIEKAPVLALPEFDPAGSPSRTFVNNISGLPSSIDISSSDSGVSLYASVRYNALDASGNILAAELDFIDNSPVLPYTATIKVPTFPGYSITLPPYAYEIVLTARSELFYENILYTSEIKQRYYYYKP